MEWTDIYSGKRHRIATTIDSARPDVIPIKTLRMVIEEWAANPEPKSLGPDGQPCARATLGLLARRPIRVSGTLITYIGKESNRLDEAQTGLWTDIGDVLNYYHDPARNLYSTLVIQAIRQIGPAQVARVAGLDRRTVERIVRGSQPHPDAKTRINRALQGLLGQPRRRLQISHLAAFLETAVQPGCITCGKPLADRQRGAKYCGDRCRMRHARAVDGS
jgi:hypothetical protein